VILPVSDAVVDWERRSKGKTVSTRTAPRKRHRSFLFRAGAQPGIPPPEEVQSIFESN